MKTPQSPKPPTGAMTFLEGSVILGDRTLDDTGTATL